MKFESALDVLQEIKSLREKRKDLNLLIKQLYASKITGDNFKQVADKIYELERERDLNLDRSEELWNYLNKLREEEYLKKKKEIGRPAIGETRKVSVTLPNSYWKKIDQLIEHGHYASRSELFREMVSASLNFDCEAVVKEK